MRRLLPGVALAWLLLAPPPPMHAATTILSSQNPNQNLFAQTDGAQFLDLGDGNGTTFTVDLAVSARLAIFLSAECTVAGDDDTTWLDIDIVVNGTAIGPSNDDDAFCTSNGDSALNGWLFASRDVVVDLAAGVHQIQVRGVLMGADPVDQWRVDDLALIVIVDED